MERDTYNGYPQIKAEATGFFYTKEIGNRWWFIDPLGNVFMPFGVNHALSYKFAQASYNKEHWDKTTKTKKGFYKHFENDMKYLNMTAEGYNYNIREWMEHIEDRKFPYVITLNFPVQRTFENENEFPDVFSEEYEQKCMQVAESILPQVKDDPMLIGLYLCDVAEWSIYGGETNKFRDGDWCDTIKRRGADSAGKQAYVSLMKERYVTIEAFNSVYATTFLSFNELLSDTSFVFNTPLNFEAARQDHCAFLTQIAERFYSLTCGIVRKYDTNHLILGDIFDANYLIPTEIINAAKKYADVISLQYYGYYKNQAEKIAFFHEITGKPVLLADSCFSVQTPEMPRTVGTRVRSQTERAVEFERYFHQVIKIPYVIGWFWCGYIDSSPELQPTNCHSGIKDWFGNYHEPLCSRMRELYGKAYGYADIR